MISYLCEVICIDTIKSKYLKNNKWFHGTISCSKKNILDQGIDVFFNRGSELDFGPGFYLTNKIHTAENYAKLKSKLTHIEDNLPIVLEYNFSIEEIINQLDPKNHKTLHLKGFNSDFGEFVFENRLKSLDLDNPDYFNEDYYHDYDLVFGCITDGNPIEIFQNYKNQNITKTEAINKLKQSNSFGRQLTFCNQELANIFLKNPIIHKIKIGS